MRVRRRFFQILLRFVAGTQRELHVFSHQTFLGFRAMGRPLLLDLLASLSIRGCPSLSFTVASSKAKLAAKSLSPVPCSGVSLNSSSPTLHSIHSEFTTSRNSWIVNSTLTRKTGISPDSSIETSEGGPLDPALLQYKKNFLSFHRRNIGIYHETREGRFDVGPGKNH